jgi:hypothetical protein
MVTVVVLTVGEVADVLGLAEDVAATPGNRGWRNSIHESR